MKNPVTSSSSTAVAYTSKSPTSVATSSKRKREVEKSEAKLSRTKSQADIFSDLKVSSSVAKSVNSLPFSSQKKYDKEDVIDYSIGSFPLDSHVRMYAEITSKDEFLGSLYHEKGELVFEPANFGTNQKLLISKESFYLAIKSALHELEEYDSHESK